MFQPTAFMDGANIVVVNTTPYYRYSGSTYLDKLKNGLSLDYVFYQQSLIPTEYVASSEEVDTILPDGQKSSEPGLTEYMYGLEKCEMFEQTIGMARKGKRPPFKKRQARNQKKTTTKLNGYNDKLFAIEQELPDVWDESQIEIDYEYDYDDDDNWTYN